MQDILAKLAASARERSRREQLTSPLPQVAYAALTLPVGDRPFERALRHDGISFICECKKASPSKGLISPDFPYLDIARSYQAAGADAISVLTEPDYFWGRDSYLDEISHAVDIPCLRKDFTIDEYMIYRAKILGASAILLICAILDDAELRSFLALAGQLGLSALVEAHDEREIDRALDAGAAIIGVNNRDLRDFSVDTGNSARLRANVPRDILFVAESGITSRADVEAMQAAGADAVLVGEALMRAPDISRALSELRGGL